MARVPHGHQQRRDPLDAGSALEREVPELSSILADPQRIKQLSQADVPALILLLFSAVQTLAARLETAADPDPVEIHTADDAVREWLTIDEASALYRVSKSFLYRNAMRLGIARKLGAKLLISRKLFDRYLQRGKI